VRFLVQTYPDAAIQYTMEIGIHYGTDLWKMALGIIPPERFFRQLNKNPLSLFIYQRYCFEPRHLLLAIATYPDAKILVRRFKALPQEDQKSGFALFKQMHLYKQQAWDLFQALQSEKKSL
jgi:hypothetical protein